jgi:hypothetical protein
MFSYCGLLYHRGLDALPIDTGQMPAGFTKKKQIRETKTLLWSPIHFLLDKEISVSITSQIKRCGKPSSRGKLSG